MTTRRLIKVAKKHGLCLSYGRKVMFTSKHLAGIIEAMRHPADSRQPLHEQVTSTDLFPGSAYARALALVTERQRNRTKARKESK